MKKAKRILVGLKTQEHAVELTDIACRLGVDNANLLLVHIIELPDPTPLDAEVPDLDALAKKIIATAKRVASHSEMKVSSLVLRAHDAGHALLEEMRDKKVELAVIGYHHREMLAEVLLGTTAQHLSKHAPCHLVIDVPPRD